MAVLEDIPQITVRVRVVGELATEYDPPDDFGPDDDSDPEGAPTPTKHCFIESKSGAKYAVVVTLRRGLKLPKGHNQVAVHLYIDGQWMNGVAINRNRIGSSPHVSCIANTVCAGGINNGKPIMKDFVFSPISRTDSATKQKIDDDIKRAKNLGKINVSLVTGKLGERKPWKPTTHDGQVSDLAEKALKGKEISHGTSLTESTANAPLTSTRLRSVRPLADFFFHYRSHEALQHEMIIPRTPSPEPSVTISHAEDVLSHLSESDIRRLAMERLHENQIKNESPIVKREADQTPSTSRPWKIVKLDDGKQAIDLTDD